MKRELEIMELTPPQRVGCVTFSITKQTHKGLSFADNFKGDMDGGEGFEEFKASNGVVMGSYEFPEWEEDSNTLMVRGDESNLDDRQITVSDSDYKKIKEAVAEYNGYSNGEEKTPKTKVKHTEDEVLTFLSERVKSNKDLIAKLREEKKELDIRIKALTHQGNSTKLAFDTYKNSL